MLEDLQRFYYLYIKYLLPFIYKSIVITSVIHWWQILIGLFFFCSLGYGIILLIPPVRDKFNELIDRLILSLIFGLSYFTLLFMILNPVLRIKVSLLNIIIVYLLSVIPTYAYLIRKKIDFWGKRGRYQWIIFACLFVIFVMGLKMRIAYTVKHPDKLLDSDPYRHKPRTEWIIKSGYINKWEPWIIGTVPIYEMQGCYILAAVIYFITGLKTFFIWKYLSPTFGALSIIAVYFWAKYTFNKNNMIGLIAAAIIACIPVHITRTNIGFSEPWGLPYLALAMLFFFLYTQDLKLWYAFLFGAFFTTLAMHNMVPNVFMIVILSMYSIYIFIFRRRFAIVKGIALSAAVFLLYIIIWATTYLGVPLSTGGKAHKDISYTEMHISSAELNFDTLVNKSYIRTFYYYLGLVGLLLLITTPITKKYARNELKSNIFYVRLFFLLLVFYFAYLLSIGAKYSFGNFCYFGTALLLFLTAIPLDKKFQWNDEYKSDFFDICIFYVLFFILYFTYFLSLDIKMPFTDTYIPTFTNKLYRYLLFPAYCIAILSGYAIYIIYKYICQSLDWAFFSVSKEEHDKNIKQKIEQKRKLKPEQKQKLVEKLKLEHKQKLAKLHKLHLIVKSILYSIIVFAVCIMLLTGLRYGDWPPSPTEAEFKAFDWINKNIPKDAIFFANWFTGDFIRCQCERSFIITSYLRDNVRYTAKANNLAIPVPLSISDILDYVNKHKESGNYYVLKSKYGPFFPFESDSSFKLIALFKGGEPAWIYEITSNPVKVQPKEDIGFSPIAGAELNEISIDNLDRLIDGEIGANSDNDAAMTTPTQLKPVRGWFGIDFHNERTISEVTAYPLLYNNGNLINKNEFTYLAHHYVLQYWEQEKWKDIPGTEVMNNKQKRIAHIFAPIKTSCIRIYIYDEYNNQGELEAKDSSRVYRAACLELTTK